MKCSFTHGLCVAGLLALPFFASTAWAYDSPGNANETDELARMSLEELGNIVVTSVSKKPEQLSAAAASIFVITRDDIRRSGATNLPEALRLAPNLEIAQNSSSGYVIGARGFNGASGNKMLVLIDGRSVYTPLFSGVFWDEQDVVLEDIERIEVISGPGGTLWGVNAVNGVINIITRSAKDTQGTYISTGAGNMRDATSLRYGGTIGDDINYRVYAKTFDDRGTELASGSPVNDGWHRSQTGFRMDWGQTTDKFSLQGNAYNGAEAQPVPGEIQVGVQIPLGEVLISGANLSGNWTHQLADGASISVQSYFDRTSRNVIPVFDDHEDIFDLQILHALAPLGAHAVAWGAEYRYGMDNVVNSPYVAFLPAKLNQTWSSLFAQDQWALGSKLQLTVGARIERNDYTGNEFLPNLRLAWQISPTDMWWSAISRTVRAPSRLDHDTYVPGEPPYELAGGPNFLSEVARVLETGYRGQLAQSLSYSVTIYHADYDHLISALLVPSQGDAIFTNGMRGSTTGIETWGNYIVTPTWRLAAGFTALREYIQFYQPGPLAFSQLDVGQDPPQSCILRSSFDLPHQMELDITLRHVGALANPDVPAYSALGGRLGWRATKNLELSMTVQNLIGSGHGEFGDISTRTEFGRTMYFKAVTKF